jgi:hypothetical protein
MHAVSRDLHGALLLPQFNSPTKQDLNDTSRMIDCASPNDIA